MAMAEPVVYTLGEIRMRETVLTSSSSNSQSHYITIDELGIDIEIPVDDGGGIQPGQTITPTEAGTFRLYCSAHPEPEAHGNFFIVVS